MAGPRFIVNPKSGGGRTGEAWAGIAARLAAQLGPLDVVMTQGPGDATRLAREAVAAGVPEIVAVGGDGTLNEVVNGFGDGTSPPLDAPALSFIMAGSGGDFRRSFGVGDSLEDRLARYLAGTPRPVDMGSLSAFDDQGRPFTRAFINIASFGMSGHVVRAVNRARFSKLLGGRFAFFWASLTALAGYRPAPIRLLADGVQVFEGPVNTVAIANGIYFGGGMKVAPMADPADGLLNVIVLADFDLKAQLSDPGRLYRGDHLGRPGVHVFSGKVIEAVPLGHAPVLIDCDGEAPGQLPARFSLLPNAITLRI